MLELSPSAVISGLNFRKDDVKRPPALAGGRSSESSSPRCGRWVSWHLARPHPSMCLRPALSTRILPSHPDGPEGLFSRLCNARTRAEDSRSLPNLLFPTASCAFEPTARNWPFVLIFRDAREASSLAPDGRAHANARGHGRPRLRGRRGAVARRARRPAPGTVTEVTRQEQAAAPVAARAVGRRPMSSRRGSRLSLETRDWRPR